MSRPRLIADQQIPLVESILSPYMDVVLLPATAITHAAIKNADALWIRSVTPITENLISNTSVKFVGTVTSGFDHLDTHWLNAQHIAWAAAHGCNARAVADYVISVLVQAHLSGKFTKAWREMTIGIIGMGHVGTQVAALLQAIGCQLVYSDPPRAKRDANFNDTPLRQWPLVDAVCVHASLTHTDDHPSFHLLDANFLQRLQPNTVLIHAARGPVVDFAALKFYGQHLIWCLDVWEPEPNIALDMLAHAWIATPHIAGHAIESKWRASLMIYEAMRKHFNLPPCDITLNTLNPGIKIELEDTITDWENVIAHLYNPHEDAQSLHDALANSANIATTFETQRKNYRLRHEFPFLQINSTRLPNADQQLIKALLTS